MTREIGQINADGVRGARKRCLSFSRKRESGSVERYFGQRTYLQSALEEPCVCKLESRFLLSRE